MTTPAPHEPPDARPRRRTHPRVVALRVCGLLWVVCSVATIGLVQASLRAEELNDQYYDYAGPSEYDVDKVAALTFSLGLLALLTGIALVVDGALRRWVGTAADGPRGPVPPAP